MLSNRRHSAILVCLVALPCLAQTYEPVPVIQLSPEESAQARRLATGLREAQDRSIAAEDARKSFGQAYQAAHPDVPNLQFTSDLRHAFSYLPSARDGVRKMNLIELSPEESAKLSAIEHESSAALEAFQVARSAWQDFKNNLIAHHTPVSLPATQNTASNFRQITDPNLWAFGPAFSPDFRFAVPASRPY